MTPIDLIKKKMYFFYTLFRNGNKYILRKKILPYIDT